jgi:hypothetical protein
VATQTYKPSLPPTSVLLYSHQCQTTIVFLARPSFREGIRRHILRWDIATGRICRQSSYGKMTNVDIVQPCAWNVLDELRRIVQDIMIVLDVATTLLYTEACILHEVAYSDGYSNTVGLSEDFWIQRWGSVCDADVRCTGEIPMIRFAAMRCGEHGFALYAEHCSTAHMISRLVTQTRNLRYIMSKSSTCSAIYVSRPFLKDEWSLSRLTNSMR